jgi:hypothetical protein
MTMGLIHSRARKQRDRAERDVLREEARQLKTEREAAEAEAAEDLPWYRQPTVGGAIRRLRGVF